MLKLLRGMSIRVLLLSLLVTLMPTYAKLNVAAEYLTPEFEWVATWGASDYSGVLNRPVGIAADASGNVYLVDRGIHRVQVFDANGAFLFSMGQIGAGDGQLFSPTDVAVRGELVYVTDSQNSRIQVFGTDSAFVRQVGGWSADLTSMQNPYLAGADGAGNVYVMDGGASMFSRFLPDGVFDRNYDGLECSGEDLVVASSNFFFCPHRYENGVIRVSEDGSRSRIGGDPEEPGFVSDASSLALTSDDHLWVYDQHTYRVNHFDPDGVFLGGFDLADAASGLAASADRLFVLTSEGQVAVYDIDGSVLSTWGATGDLEFDHPDGLAPAPDGTLYVLEKTRNRILHLDANGNVLAQIGTGAADQGNLAAPSDMVVDGMGRLNVLDNAFVPRVVRFVDGQFDKVFYGGIYSLANTKPMMGILATGDWLLLMHRHGSFTQVDLDGNLHADAETTGTDRFVDITVTSTDQVYRLANEQSPHVRITTLTGSPLMSWGDAGTASGQLTEPSGIALDLRGRVFIVDTKSRPGRFSGPRHSHRVQVFDEAGTYLAGWGGLGDGLGEFAAPQSVAALPDGRIVVADTENNRLQVFEPVGVLPDLNPLPEPTQYQVNSQPLFITWQDHGPMGIEAPLALAVPTALSDTSPLIATYGNPGQLAVSTDGLHWSRSPGDFPGDLSYVSPVFAGMDTLVAGARWYDSLYRSVDFGDTWIRLGDAPAYGPQSIAASSDYETDGALFTAAYRSGFWRSNDAGTSWNLISLAGKSLNNLAIATTAAGTRVLFVNDHTTGSQLLRSDDDGHNWMDTGQSTGHIALSPGFADDQTAFLAEPGNYDGGLLRSQDGGVTWQRVGVNTLPSPEWWTGITVSPNYANDQTLAVWSSTNGYISTDSGETWTQFTPSEVNSLDLLVFAPTYSQDNRILLSSTALNAFLVSQDQGATWQPVVDGMPGAYVGAVDPGQSAAMADWLLVPSGLLTRDGEGWSWMRRYQYPVARNGVLRRSPTFAEDGVAFLHNEFTSDAGATWQALGSSDSWTYSSAAFAPDWLSSRTAAVVKDAADLYNPEVMITVDGGLTWSAHSLTSVRLPGHIIFDAAWPEVPRLYAGGLGGVRYSVDLGHSWHTVAEPVASLRITQLMSRLEGRRSVLYAATRSLGIWRSADGGATWIAMSAGLANGQVCALTGDDDILVAGLCDGTLYIKTADQDTWQWLAPRPGRPITTLALQQHADQRVLWVGTGSGVFAANLDPTTPGSALAFTMDTNRAWLPPGTSVTATLTLTNDGDVPAPGAYVTMTLPAELSTPLWLSATVSSLIYDPVAHRITWIGDVPADTVTRLAFSSLISSTIVSCGELPIEAAVSFNGTGTQTTSITLVVPDVDCSGNVNVVDVQRVAARWGVRLGDRRYHPRYDLNANDTVDVLDIVIVTQMWN